MLRCHPAGHPPTFARSPTKAATCPRQ